MQGIYCIINLINNKKYVGISNDIEFRWRQHINVLNYPKLETYNYPLYRAFRKYGIENFKFEVLEEENNLTLRKEKEKQYIIKFDSIKNGYNQILEAMSEVRRKLSEDDVYNIRLRWGSCKESIKQIYEDYKEICSFETVRQICKWNGWPDILPELYNEENRRKHFLMGHSSALHGKLTENDVIDIRIRHFFNKETPTQIAPDYPVVSLRSIKAICYYETWKNISKERVKEEYDKRL